MPPVPTLSSALPSGGGFFLPSYESTSASAAASSSSSSTHLIPLPTEPQDALRLSPVQLTRLRSHLDLRILSIQRRWAKRFHHAQTSSTESVAAGTEAPTVSSSSDPLISGGLPLDSPGKYANAWMDEVLPLLVRVDPLGASQSTTVLAYAMRMTELLLGGVVGYEMLQERDRGEESSNGAQRGEMGGGGEEERRSSSTSGLTRILQALHLVDALWASLLAGRRLSLPHALARSSAALSIASSSNSNSDSVSSTTGAPAPAPASSAPGATIRDSLPLSGSMGTKTLSGTDRVRLRNLLVDRRGEVRRWVAEVLGVVLAGPAPGEEVDRSLPGVERRGEYGGSIPPMQRRRKKRGRAALVEPQDATTTAFAREVREVESDTEQGDLHTAAASAPATKRRKQTRGDTQLATQIKEESDDDEEEEEEEEDEMEEVAVPISAANGSQPELGQRFKEEDEAEEVDAAEPEPEPETEEHRHYQALFDRKIELDDEEDEEDDEDEDDDQDWGKRTADSLDEDEDDDQAHLAVDQGRGEGSALFSPQKKDSVALQVNGNSNGHDHSHDHSHGHGYGPGDSNANANGDGDGDTDASRLGSFELDVLLARLFSRSLALLERLE